MKLTRLLKSSCWVEEGAADVDTHPDLTGLVMGTVLYPSAG